MILLDHLKELTLSFQKNIKSLKLDTPNKSYGHSKIPSTYCIDIHCVHYTMKVLIFMEQLKSSEGLLPHELPLT